MGGSTSIVSKIVIRLLAVLVTGVALFGLASAYIIVHQERFIFPGLQIPKSEGAYRLLPGVRALRIPTSDGETLQGFTSLVPGESPRFVAIIMHGNGESAENQNFIPFFRNVGIPALTFDYRGFGDSTGWPSEQGLYRDAEAAAEKAKELSGLPYSQFVVLGNSIGSGPAAYLARKIQPRAVLLLAGYADFEELVKAQPPPYSLLTFALRYRFPVRDFLRGLNEQCVILAHGKGDQVIPFSNLSELVSALPKSAAVKVLESESAGHNDIFYKVEQQLVQSTRDCLGIS